jgi:hypothetical protein
MDSFDDLQEVLQGIEQKAKEHGLYIFESEEIAYPSVLKLDWQGEWTEYLEVAGLAKALFLYLEVERFDLEEANRAFMLTQTAKRIQRTHPAISPNDEDDESNDEDEDDWLFQRLIEQTEAWREYQQRIGYIACLWFKDGVGHYLQLEASWYNNYTTAAWKVLEDADKVSIESRRIRSKEEAATRLQQAKQLAYHPRFVDASIDEKRRYMAAQLFPKLSYSGVTSVVSLAQAVYWWEVEPEMRATKDQKALDLWAGGESIQNIATLLGMPEAKVRTAIKASQKS